jgi:hypothetical protein
MGEQKKISGWMESAKTGIVSRWLHHRSDGVLFGPLFCGIHIMKLRELMVELEKSADSNPEVRFESVTYQAGGKTSKDAGFVDAKLNDGTVTIRVAVPPYDVENVRDCENDI